MNMRVLLKIIKWKGGEIQMFWTKDRKEIKELKELRKKVIKELNELI